MASLLREETTPKFKGASLSTALREAWLAKNEAASIPRRALQELGNQWRKEERGRLARLAIERVVAGSEADEPIEYVVLDGIRNTGEIEYLRERFGERFFLLAIDAPASAVFLKWLVVWWLW